MEQGNKKTENRRIESLRERERGQPTMSTSTSTKVVMLVVPTPLNQSTLPLSCPRKANGARIVVIKKRIRANECPRVEKNCAGKRENEAINVLFFRNRRASKKKKTSGGHQKKKSKTLTAGRDKLLVLLDGPDGPAELLPGSDVSGGRHRKGRCVLKRDGKKRFLLRETEEEREKNDNEEEREESEDRLSLPSGKI